MVIFLEGILFVSKHRKEVTSMKREVDEKDRAGHYRRAHYYWESRAMKYPEEPKQGVVDRVLSILRKAKSSKILDIGSGPAHYAIKFAKALASQITCLDFSQEMIRRARKNVEKEGLDVQFSFVEGDVLDADLPPGSFDAVTFISILHYLFPADIETALQKSYATLKVGGKIVIVEYWVNDKLTEVEEVTLQIAEQSRTKQGLEAIFLKEGDYRRLLMRAGFKEVKVFYVLERIYLGKYFEMNPELQSDGNAEESIRVAVFEATK